jgi:uncharacterized protein YmfQ (DUF2313 family)
MVDIVNLSLDDFLRSTQRLLPRGAAWPRDDDAVLTQVSQAIADGAYTHHQAVLNLSEVESDPFHTIELLPDWETDYGLPDPCTPLNPTIDQRRRALLAKIAEKGGQSRAYYIGVAAALGFTVTITEFNTFRLGVSHFGDLLCGPGWQFVWQVNAPAITVEYFRFGISAFGEPFWTVDNTELECRLRAIMPAHTILNFAYS